MPSQRYRQEECRQPLFLLQIFSCRALLVVLLGLSDLHQPMTTMDPRQPQHERARKHLAYLKCPAVIGHQCHDVECVPSTKTNHIARRRQTQVRKESRKILRMVLFQDTRGGSDWSRLRFPWLLHAFIDFDD